MAMSADVRYISYYMEGSTARKVERKPQVRTVTLPKPVVKTRQRPIIKVDPVAVVGIVLAVVMLVSLFSVYGQYHSWVEKNAQLSQYIESLQQEQTQLQAEYEASYDLEQVKQIADAIGMVPAQDANRITVDVRVPEMEQTQLSFWENISIFLAGLFA